MNELPKSVRDELARQQAAGTHPDPDLLTAYSEGTATPSEREQIEQHLAICEGCREVLFLSLPEKPAETPSVVATKVRSRWFPVWVAWSAAAAVLIVATVTYTRQTPSQTAKLAKTEAPASAPVTASADKSEEMHAYQAKADSNSPFRGESRAKMAPGIVAPKPNNSTSKKEINEAFHRDELEESETQDSLGYLNKHIYAANPVAGAQPSVAPPPEQPTYAARAARNAAPKPGPAAPLQNQMQNQTQNQAAQNVAVGTPTEAVEVTNESIPVQDAKVPTTLARSTATLKMLPVAQWRISAAGVVERALAPPNWTPSLSRPGVKFTVVASVGSVVWAGGTQGALFRSLDAGATWLPVTLPNVADQTISKIEFRDARHGTIAAANRRSWTTSNGGETWQQH